MARSLSLLSSSCLLYCDREWCVYIVDIIYAALPIVAIIPMHSRCFKTCLQTQATLMSFLCTHRVSPRENARVATSWTRTALLPFPSADRFEAWTDRFRREDLLAIISDVSPQRDPADGRNTSSSETRRNKILARRQSETRMNQTGLCSNERDHSIRILAGCWPMCRPRGMW